MIPGVFGTWGKHKQEEEKSIRVDWFLLENKKPRLEVRLGCAHRTTM